MQASIDICFYALYRFGNDLSIGFCSTLKLEGHPSVGADRTLFIITVNPLLCFINGDFAFNVILCGIQQIGRSIQPVNCLQADGCLPRLAFFGSVGFALLYIFFKFKLSILIRHIGTSFLVSKLMF